ncbi:hypothetical protein PESP_a0888 [Pseudoalteromonas espejiana DSM 9414]|nr:hypothetical protein PESP_a0888 [Pseudoalteromonas espejiana DSM 9414]
MDTCYYQVSWYLFCPSLTLALNYKTMQVLSNNVSAKWQYGYVAFSGHA